MLRNPNSRKFNQRVAKREEWQEEFSEAHKQRKEQEHREIAEAVKKFQLSGKCITKLPDQATPARIGADFRQNPDEEEG